MNDDTVMVTIDSVVHGVKQLLLDAKHVSIVKYHNIHLTTKKYAGFKIDRVETYVHIWLYKQEHPDYVPCIKTSLVDHKNHNTFDCRMSNPCNVTPEGNNNNLARREGTNYSTNPMADLGAAQEQSTQKRIPNGS